MMVLEGGPCQWKDGVGAGSWSVRVVMEMVQGCQTGVSNKEMTMT